jgi:hypothetical protein
VDSLLVRADPALLVPVNLRSTSEERQVAKKQSLVSPIRPGIVGRSTEPSKFQNEAADTCNVDRLCLHKGQAELPLCAVLNSPTATVWKMRERKEIIAMEIMKTGQTYSTTIPTLRMVKMLLQRLRVAERSCCYH